MRRTASNSTAPPRRARAPGARKGVAMVATHFGKGFVSRPRERANAGFAPGDEPAPRMVRPRGKLLDLARRATPGIFQPAEWRRMQWLWLGVSPARRDRDGRVRPRRGSSLRGDAEPAWRQAAESPVVCDGGRRRPVGLPPPAARAHQLARERDQNPQRESTGTSSMPGSGTCSRRRSRRTSAAKHWARNRSSGAAAPRRCAGRFR